MLRFHLRLISISLNYKNKWRSIFWFDHDVCVCIFSVCETLISVYHGSFLNNRENPAIFHVLLFNKAAVSTIFRLMFKNGLNRTNITTGNSAVIGLPARRVLCTTIIVFYTIVTHCAHTKKKKKIPFFFYRISRNFLARHTVTSGTGNFPRPSV